jgi:hypothetical protein
MGRRPEYAEASEIAAATNVYFMEHREELLNEARAHPVAIHYRHQEQMRLARKAVIAEIREKGRKVNSIAPEELRKLVKAYLEEHPWECRNQGNLGASNPLGEWSGFLHNYEHSPFHKLDNTRPIQS